MRSNFAYKGRARSLGKGNERRINDSSSSVDDKKLESFFGSVRQHGAGSTGIGFFTERPFSIFLRQLREQRGIIVHSPTVRTLLPVRYACTCVRVCVCACVARICATHIYRVSRGTLRRAASTFLYGIACEQVCLRNDRGEIIKAPAGAYARVRVAKRMILARLFLSHVKISLLSCALSVEKTINSIKLYR